MEIAQIQKEVHQNAKAKGFWDNNPEISEKLMLIVCEVAEAAEADRKGYIQKVPITNPKLPNEEIWKDIMGYENKYLVSNLGNIRSLDRIVKEKGGKERFKCGQMLRPGKAKTGYYTVALDGKSHRVCRLVAQAFIPNPKNLPCVNHINGNKCDDFLTNLEWVSHSENNKHALATGLRNPEKILTYSDKVNISFLTKSGVSQKDIATKFPQVKKSAVARICQNYDKYISSVEFELADVVIRVLDLAEALHIDLEWHIEQKHKYNTMRPYKHGKKY